MAGVVATFGINYHTYSSTTAAAASGLIRLYKIQSKASRNCVIVCFTKTKHSMAKNGKQKNTKMCNCKLSS